MRNFLLHRKFDDLGNVCDIAFTSYYILLKYFLRMTLIVIKKYKVEKVNKKD